jgi:hypothetical protein
VRGFSASSTTRVPLAAAVPASSSAARSASAAPATRLFSAAPDAAGSDDSHSGTKSAVHRELERRAREKQIRHAWKPAKTLKEIMGQPGAPSEGRDDPRCAELHEGILMHFKYKGVCSQKWLASLMRLASTPADYYRALDAYLVFYRQAPPSRARADGSSASTHVADSPMIASLVLGAAVRAGIPDAGLRMLANVHGFRFFPGNMAIVRLVRALGAAQDGDGVSMCYEAVRQRHIAVGSSLTSAFVGAFLASGEPRAAAEVLVELLQEPAADEENENRVTPYDVSRVLFALRSGEEAASKDEGAEAEAGDGEESESAPESEGEAAASNERTPEELAALVLATANKAGLEVRDWS